MGMFGGGRGRSSAITPTRDLEAERIAREQREAGIRHTERIRFQEQLATERIRQQSAMTQASSTLSDWKGGSLDAEAAALTAILRDRRTQERESIAEKLKSAGSGRSGINLVVDVDPPGRATPSTGAGAGTGTTTATTRPRRPGSSGLLEEDDEEDDE